MPSHLNPYVYPDNNGADLQYRSALVYVGRGWENDLDLSNSGRKQSEIESLVPPLTERSPLLLW